MKTVTISFDTYEEEMAFSGRAGYNDGISTVMKWLESKQPLCKFLGEGVIPSSDWGRIAKALGRENELTFEFFTSEAEFK